MHISRIKKKLYFDERIEAVENAKAATYNSMNPTESIFICKGYPKCNGTPDWLPEGKSCNACTVIRGDDFRDTEKILKEMERLN